MGKVCLVHHVRASYDIFCPVASYFGSFSFDLICICTEISSTSVPEDPDCMEIISIAVSVGHGWRDNSSTSCVEILDLLHWKWELKFSGNWNWNAFLEDSFVIQYSYEALTNKTHFQQLLYYIWSINNCLSLPEHLSSLKWKSFTKLFFFCTWLPMTAVPVSQIPKDKNR